MRKFSAVWKKSSRRFSRDNSTTKHTKVTKIRILFRDVAIHSYYDSKNLVTTKDTKSTKNENRGEFQTRPDFVNFVLFVVKSPHVFYRFTRS